MTIRRCFRFQLSFFMLLILVHHISIAATFDVNRNYQIVLKHLNLQYPAGNADKQLLELDVLKKEVDKVSAQNPENSVYWFFKGAYSFAYIYAYSRQLRETSKELSKEEKIERGKAFQKKRKVLVRNTTQSFAKALELDSEEKPALTMGMLDLITSFGGHELAIKALRRSYSHMEYDPYSTEQYNWRRSVVSHLMSLGRFDEAKEELMRIKKEYPKRETSTNINLKMLEKKREKYEAEQKAGKSPEAKKQDKKVVKDDFLTRQQLEELLKDTTVQKSTPSTPHKKDNGSIRNVIIAVIALLVLIIMGGFAYRKMKR